MIETIYAFFYDLGDIEPAAYFKYESDATDFSKKQEKPECCCIVPLEVIDTSWMNLIRSATFPWSKK